MITISKNVVEGVKEVVRTSLMAVLPVIIYDLGSNKFHWQAWLLGFIIALLSGIDKWLHKSNKGLDGNGLTGI